jgi:ABC-2 type transporter
MSQTALFKTLNLFPPEKALVGVERAKGSYNVLPYFLSKVLAELPIVAVYPLVFSAIAYPMTGLQPTVRLRTLPLRGHPRGSMAEKPPDT